MRPVDESTLESKTIGNQLSDLSMHIPVECQPPPNIDITCIEKSPWRRGRERCQVCDVVRQTVLVSNSQIRWSMCSWQRSRALIWGRGRCLNWCWVEESAFSHGIGGGGKSCQRQEAEYCWDERWNVGYMVLCCTCMFVSRVLSSYGTLAITDTIPFPPLFPSSLPPLTSYPPLLSSLPFPSSSSSSYTCIFSQSELRHHDSELHGETLDAELEQFEQELMEGGDVAVDSKTDGDLMLEMEEFL